MKSPFMRKIGTVWEFIPIFLILFVLVAEHEMSFHMFNLSCRLIISLVAVIVFVIVFFKLKRPKHIAIIIAIITYIMLIMVKRKYVSTT